MKKIPKLYRNRLQRGAFSNATTEQTVGFVGFLRTTVDNRACSHSRRIVVKVLALWFRVACRSNSTSSSLGFFSLKKKGSTLTVSSARDAVLLNSENVVLCVGLLAISEGFLTWWLTENEIGGWLKNGYMLLFVSYLEMETGVTAPVKLCPLMFLQT